MVNELMDLGYKNDGWNIDIDEHHIYGNSRVGIHQTKKTLRRRVESYPIEVTLEAVNDIQFIRGKRNYELSNHLGNVQVVISDKRIAKCDTELEIERFEAEVLSAVDYYPFGMVMPGRQYYVSSDSSMYRFGFNGKESDNEAKGIGNQYDYGFRIYDSRLSKFLSVDPLFKSYPWYTPYQFAGNKPISSTDLDGLEEFNVVSWHNPEIDQWISKLTIVTMDAPLKVNYYTRQWLHGVPQDPQESKIATEGFTDNYLGTSTAKDPWKTDIERERGNQAMINNTEVHRRNDENSENYQFREKSDPTLIKIPKDRPPPIKAGTIATKLPGILAATPASPPSNLVTRGRIEPGMRKILTKLAADINASIDLGEPIKSININLQGNLGTTASETQLAYFEGSLDIAVGQMAQALRGAGLNSSVIIRTTTKAVRNDTNSGAGTTITVR